MADVEQKVDATTAEQVAPSEKADADAKDDSAKKEQTENAGDTEQTVTGKEEEQKAADTNEQKEEAAPAKEEEQKEAGATSESEQKVTDAQPAAEEAEAEGGDTEDVEPEPAADDVTRDPDEFRRALRKGQMVPGLTAICHNLGFTTTGVNSALYLDIPNQVILTKGGNFVRILDLKTLKSKYIEGLDGAGVGAIAVTNVSPPPPAAFEEFYIFIWISVF